MEWSKMDWLRSRIAPRFDRSQRGEWRKERADVDDPSGGFAHIDRNRLSDLLEKTVVVRVGMRDKDAEQAVVERRQAVNVGNTNCVLVLQR